MKVKEKERQKNVKFSQLNPGDVFRYDEYFYMAIVPCGGDENAVGIDDGELTEFDDTDIVLPIDGEFVER